MTEEIKKDIDSKNSIFTTSINKHVNSFTKLELINNDDKEAEISINHDLKVALFRANWLHVIDEENTLKNLKNGIHFVNDNEEYYFEILTKVINLNQEKCFEFLISNKKYISFKGIDLLISIISNPVNTDEQKIKKYNFFNSILKKIDKKSIYENSLYDLFDSICKHQSIWSLNCIENYIKLEKIKNPVNIIELIISYFSDDKEKNTSISKILTSFYKNSNSILLSDKIFDLAIDLKINGFYDLFYFFEKTKNYKPFLKENTEFLFKKIIHIYRDAKSNKTIDISLKEKNIESFLNRLISSDRAFDKNDNSIIYYCLIQSELDLILKLVRDELMPFNTFLDLIFHKNNLGFSPLDIISKLDNSYIKNTLLYVILSVIENNDSRMHEYKDSIKGDYIQSYKDTIKYHHPKLNELILKHQFKTPIIKEHVLYTKESLLNFEKHFELIENDNTQALKAFIEKIKKESNSRKIALNDKLKLNLESLRYKFPNFNDFIDFIESNIYLNDLSDNGFYIAPSLLLGSPGLGKTFFMHMLSEAVGVDAKLLNMESITAGFVLSGNSSQWSGSKQGLIFDHALNSQYGNSIFLLDEIDKTNGAYSAPVEPILLSLLEKNTSKNFKDEYIQIPLDLSRISWIATANNKKDISLPILSRLNIFEIQNPTLKERIILSKEIYLSILKDLNIINKFSSDLDDKVIEYICEHESSNRDLKKIITRSISNAAKRGDNKVNINDIYFGHLITKKIGLI